MTQPSARISMYATRSQGGGHLPPASCQGAKVAFISDTSANFDTVPTGVSGRAFHSLPLLERYPRAERPVEKVRFAPAGVSLVSRDGKKSAAIVQFALPGPRVCFSYASAENTRPFLPRIELAHVCGQREREREECQRYERGISEKQSSPTPNVKSLFHIGSSCV